MTKGHASLVAPKNTSFAGSLGDELLSSSKAQEILDGHEIGGAL
jgi:hypothetical protein